MHEKIKEAEKCTKTKDFEPNQVNSEDAMDEEENDEEGEMINFYLNQKKNRSKRTSPSAEAETSTQTGTKHNSPQFRCDKCHYKGQSQAQLTEHIN